MYDLIIIGGGPAGLSAAIYAARFNMKTILISKDIGGYMMEAPKIDNYPGYTTVSGYDLSKNMKEQVKAQNIEIIEEEIAEIKPNLEVKTKTNKKFKGKSILLALGTKRRKLDIKGEDEFAGKGVSYCATCDAPFFKDKEIIVVGGANSAIVSALLLAKFAKKVTIIYRKEKLRADPYWVKQIEKTDNIDTIFNANIKEIKGTNMVDSIILDNNKEMKVDGVFVEIGSVPSTSLVTSIGVKLEKDGCIIVDKTQKTNINHIYAAGDITTNSNNMRQIITACAEGAIAAESAYNALK
jgi:thioredoxin reductase (NADPH)